MEVSVSQRAKAGIDGHPTPLSFGEMTRELAAAVASALRSAFAFVPEAQPINYFFSNDAEASRYDWDMTGQDVTEEFEYLNRRSSAWVQKWLDETPDYE